MRNRASASLPTGETDDDNGNSSVKSTNHHRSKKYALYLIGIISFCLIFMYFMNRMESGLGKTIKVVPAKG